MAYRQDDQFGTGALSMTMLGGDAEAVDSHGLSHYKTVNAGRVDPAGRRFSMEPRLDGSFAPRCSISAKGAAVSRHPELAKFLEHQSLRRGQFILASGKPSSYYIDGKLTAMHPHGALLIAQAVLAEIESLPVDAVGGMDMGATPIVGAVAAVSEMTGRPLPVFVVRKDVKKHGTMKLIEGPIPAAPAKVVIIDDVVTTGESILKAIDAVTEAGHQVLLAISVLDRNAGATEAIARRQIRYQPLLTLEDIGIMGAD